MRSGVLFKPYRYEMSGCSSVVRGGQQQEADIGVVGCILLWMFGVRAAALAAQAGASTPTFLCASGCRAGVFNF